ncbi:MULTISPECIES: KH domain-containing protein [Bacillus amyloliquefaciens group]|uniref:KH domain-containing protein n=1 Tax=Bacillus amyloliquefaciens group TaxID=1938374 RepID=UPI0007AA77FC|nr:MULTISPECIES: KH domain-containing protein [Bacillus amyloliquefaciens group]KZE56745.1 RNA-binding protein [Bacillus amyloliquefaciens]MCQ9148741.1 KH domain-containing protein [Bacillus amyloliquefaciens]UZD75699.1 KH domain-containing protein [Bacillus siamensis]WOH98023.1 KH domain-containing protein [Bacillus amyloliquefaciens]WOI50728.1 KH domain-containing protein [Bacillus amyloliquefaciens]
MTDQNLEDLIVSIVTPLVDHPEDITVTKEETDQKIALRLSVNKSDTGKIIGKQGRTARAIRTVVFAAGAQSSKKVQFEIFD